MLVVKVETPASGGAAGRQQMPIAAGLTDGLLLLEAAPAAADAAADGPLQNVKRWMQELQFPENVSPSRDLACDCCAQMMDRSLFPTTPRG